MSTTMVTTTHPSTEIDSDLSHFMATLSLNKVRTKESENPGLRTANVAQDVIMLNSESVCQPNLSACQHPAKVGFGCPLLQAIQLQVDSNSYATTAGEYLDTIFTHRALSAAFPPGHNECARAFSDLASSLERRVYRADRYEDMEAVKAFRYEAWVVANNAM